MLQYRQSLPAFAWSVPLHDALQSKPELFIRKPAAESNNATPGGECRITSFPSGKQPGAGSGCTFDMFYGVWDVVSSEANWQWHVDNVGRSPSARHTGKSLRV